MDPLDQFGRLPPLDPRRGGVEPLRQAQGGFPCRLFMNRTADFSPQRVDSAAHVRTFDPRLRDEPLRVETRAPDPKRVQPPLVPSLSSRPLLEARLSMNRTADFSPQRVDSAAHVRTFEPRLRDEPLRVKTRGPFSSSKTSVHGPQFTSIFGGPTSP